MEEGEKLLIIFLIIPILLGIFLIGGNYINYGDKQDKCIENGYERTYDYPEVRFGFQCERTIIYSDGSEGTQISIGRYYLN